MAEATETKTKKTDPWQGFTPQDIEIRTLQNQSQSLVLSIRIIDVKSNQFVVVQNDQRTKDSYQRALTNGLKELRALIGKK